MPVFFLPSRLERDLAHVLQGDLDGLADLLGLEWNAREVDVFV
jgi:hypothetical protein